MKSPCCVEALLAVLLGAFTLSSACNLKFSDDPSLQSTDGWNVLSADCFCIGYYADTIVSGGTAPDLVFDRRISAGKTMKIKKDPAIAGEVKIRASDSYYGTKSILFELNGGALEIEGLTLTGGWDRQPIFITEHHYTTPSSVFSVTVRLMQRAGSFVA